jgi:HEAT repeat protein
MIYVGTDNYYDILAARGMIANDINEIYDSLHHKDYRVRTFAAQTIQVNYPTLQSFEIARRMLLSKKYYKREIGAYILGQLGTPNMPYAEKSLTLLYKLLDDKSKQVISTSISSIGHLWSHTVILKDKKIIEKIIKFTEDKSLNIRISSVMALSSLPYTKDIENIIRNILKYDNNDEVKEWAEIALEILLDMD